MRIARGYRNRSRIWKSSVIAACVGLGVGLVPATPALAVGTTAEGPVQYMQVVAHPDDDPLHARPPRPHRHGRVPDRRARQLHRHRDRGAVSGGWTSNPSQFGGQGGYGQVALATAPPGADARIMVFERNANTGVSLAMQQAPDSGYGDWTDLGGTIVDSPSVVVDVNGAVALFVIGADGKVYVKRQASAGANVAFGAWQQVG